MKIIKIILISFIILIALVLIVALFIPKDYKLERSIVIQSPKDTVFNYIKHLKNQNEYSVWNKMDPNIKNKYTGIDGTVGFVSAWESEVKNVGIGSQTITKIIEGESMFTKLKFEKPFKAENNTEISAIALNNSNTKVSWSFNGSFAYPMNIMKLVFNMEKMIGKDFEIGLQNMKVILEKK
jgi:hypothetical protein